MTVVSWSYPTTTLVPISRNPALLTNFTGRWYALAPQMRPAAVCSTSNQPMVMTTLVRAGLPVSGRIVKRSMTNPMPMPTAMAAMSPIHPGAPDFTETW